LETVKARGEQCTTSKLSALRESGAGFTGAAALQHYVRPTIRRPERKSQQRTGQQRTGQRALILAETILAEDEAHDRLEKAA
jgi:hypothetical protein